MKKNPWLLSFALTLMLMAVPEIARAEAAVEPVVSVGGTTGDCALIQVAAGNFNAGGYLAVDVSTSGGKAIFSTAMLAFTMGKQIWVNRTPQAPGCYGLTDYATDVRIMN